VVTKLLPIPHSAQVTTLILEHVVYISLKRSWISLIQSIPLTVIYIRLKGNFIFRRLDIPLRDLEPYNKQGRLNLLDNGYDDWVRAALPLINAVEQHVVPNMDCAYHIATFLRAKSLTLFKALAQKKRIPPQEVEEYALKSHTASAL